MSLSSRISALINAIGADMKIALAQNNFLTITVDLGYPAKKSGSFLITGFTNLTVGKNVIVSQAAGSEDDFDAIDARGVVVNSSTIKVFYNSAYTVGGSYTFNYIIQK